MKHAQGSIRLFVMIVDTIRALRSVVVKLFLFYFWLVLAGTDFHERGTQVQTV